MSSHKRFPPEPGIMNSEAEETAACASESDGDGFAPEITRRPHNPQYRECSGTTAAQVGQRIGTTV
jgi:hypothetical protein